MNLENMFYAALELIALMLLPRLLQMAAVALAINKSSI